MLKSSLRLLLLVCFVILVITCPSAKIGPYRVITIHAEEQTVQVYTNKTIVADVLAEADLALDLAWERTVPDLTEDIISDFVIIERAAPATIAVDGQEFQVITWAGTVFDLLAEQKITLGEEDLVSLPMESPVHSGLNLKIIRVARELIQREETIAATTKYKSDATLSAGKQRVETEARDGRKENTYEVIYHDGVEVSRTLVKDKVLLQPINGLIIKGTKAVSRSGSILEGVASWYGAELHGRKTASGVPFDMHAFTAAHKTLPFGTKVKVTYLATGKTVIVEINDRGPFTPGRIIDLSAAAAKQIGLYADGIGKVKLEIIK